MARDEGLAAHPQQACIQERDACHAHTHTHTSKHASTQACMSSARVRAMHRSAKARSSRGRHSWWTRTQLNHNSEQDRHEDSGVLCPCHHN
eukprot:4244736-Prymnesium_polylepis.3